MPAALGDRAAAKAAYRFFDNPRVTEHSVLAGHFAATAARVAASALIADIPHSRLPELLPWEWR
nr:transposase [Mesorhizobium delmotii]